MVVTNVSLSFNTFKLVDLPDKIRDFFKVSYIPPGRMSAGTSCVISGIKKHIIIVEIMLFFAHGNFLKQSLLHQVLSWIFWTI